jgi:hypothetical protein
VPSAAAHDAASPFARGKFRVAELPPQLRIMGTLAQGVIFDTGWCALTWLTPHTSVAFYTSIQEVEAIHGHGGKMGHDARTMSASRVAPSDSRSAIQPARNACPASHMALTRASTAAGSKVLSIIGNALHTPAFVTPALVMKQELAG